MAIPDQNLTYGTTAVLHSLVGGREPGREPGSVAQQSPYQTRGA